MRPSRRRRRFGATSRRAVNVIRMCARVVSRACENINKYTGRGRSNRVIYYTDDAYIILLAPSVRVSGYREGLFR